LTRHSMGVLFLCLQALLYYRATSASHEALVIVGGTIGWPDGAEISEVEVWSPSSECDVSIKDPPVTFPDYPAVSFFGENLFVCGGQIPDNPYNVDNITLMNRCYMYSMADNEWSEGPTLKFFETPSSSSLKIDLFLATVGNSLVAVFKQSYSTYIPLYMSTLVDDEWSDPIPFENNPGEALFGMVAIDENHFALIQATLHSGTEFIDIIQVDTASVVVRVPMDRASCFHGFLYNGQFSCVKDITEGQERRREIWSLSFQGDFDDPTWSKAYDTDYIPWAYVWYNKVAMLDGLLTVARLEDAIVNYHYQGGDQDQWGAAALEIPREHAIIAVVPCNL